MNNKFHNGVFTTLSTDHCVSIMPFLFSVYESAQDFSFTTSPHFLWIVRLEGFTSSLYVYWEDNLYKNHDLFENIFSESLAVFKFYLVCYYRKGENKFKNAYCCVLQ